MHLNEPLYASFAQKGISVMPIASLLAPVVINKLLQKRCPSDKGGSLAGTLLATALTGGMGLLFFQGMVPSGLFSYAAFPFIGFGIGVTGLMLAILAGYSRQWVRMIPCLFVMFG